MSQSRKEDDGSRTMRSREELERRKTNELEREVSGGKSSERGE